MGVVVLVGVFCGVVVLVLEFVFCFASWLVLSGFWSWPGLLLLLFLVCFLFSVVCSRACSLLCFVTRSLLLLALAWAVAVDLAWAVAVDVAWAGAGAVVVPGLPPSPAVCPRARSSLCFASLRDSLFLGFGCGCC